MSSIVNLLSAVQFGAGAAPGPSPPSAFRAGYEYTSSIYTVSGGNRLALSFNYGYGIFNLGAPSNPTALAYEDMRSDIPPCGDGQSYIRTLTVSSDGQRFVTSLDSQAVPYHSVVGSSSGSVFNLVGGFFTKGDAVIQKTSDGRYIVYGAGPLTAADITSHLELFNQVRLVAEIYILKLIQKLT